MSRVLDDLFEALSNEQRRRILFSLVMDDEPIRLGERSDAAAGDRSVAIARRHHHLPQLEACGFIERNQQTDEIERGPKFETIEPVLKLFLERRHSFPVALV